MVEAIARNNRMLRSIVILPNENTKDVGALLQIARSIIRRKEGNQANIPIISIVFDPVARVYVAICECCSSPQGERREPNDE
jgi:hypothetical protein